ncbi:nuclease [Streptomyces sp. NPDC088733]|uniref:nuclease n=1 Tax=Streptomyces sp. NPDC088733 TaxID=3365880 RepID=UPI0038105B55
MPMLLVKGSFQITGSEPDGDTVGFVPTRHPDWNRVPGAARLDLTNSCRGKLRLDAVDALETHYGPTSAPAHQPLPFAHAARDELLAWLGFTDVRRAPDSERVVSAVPESVPGWILTGGVDVHGRCVALAGRGPLPEGTRSGQDVSVGVPLLRRTVNHHLIERGLAYPTFYSNLYEDLREELAAVTRQARTAGAGLWPQDASTAGVKVTGLSSLTDEAVVVPKLFRRLYDHLASGEFSLSPSSSFRAFLAGAADTYRIASSATPRAQVRGLHHVVELTDDGTVRMTRPIEELVFTEA